jgi:hypothetical protein
MMRQNQSAFFLFARSLGTGLIIMCGPLFTAALSNHGFRKQALPGSLFLGCLVFLLMFLSGLYIRKRTSARLLLFSLLAGSLLAAQYYLRFSWAGMVDGAVFGSYFAGGIGFLLTFLSCRFAPHNDA